MDDAERLIRLCHLLHPNTEAAIKCKQKGVSGVELVEVSAEPCSIERWHTLICLASAQMHLRLQGPQKALRYFEGLDKSIQSSSGI